MGVLVDAGIAVAVAEGVAAGSGVGTGVESGVVVFVGAGVAVKVGLGTVLAAGVGLGSSEHPASVMARSNAPTLSATALVDFDIVAPRQDDHVDVSRIPTTP